MLWLQLATLVLVACVQAGIVQDSPAGGDGKIIEALKPLRVILEGASDITPKKKTKDDGSSETDSGEVGRDKKKLRNTSKIGKKKKKKSKGGESVKQGKKKGNRKNPKLRNNGNGKKGPKKNKKGRKIKKGDGENEIGIGRGNGKEKGNGKGKNKGVKNNEKGKKIPKKKIKGNKNNQDDGEIEIEKGNRKGRKQEGGKNRKGRKKSKKNGEGRKKKGKGGKGRKKQKTRTNIVGGVKDDSNKKFECMNGNFVKKKLMCDGNDNCGDKSDEEGCNFVPKLTCNRCKTWDTGDIGAKYDTGCNKRGYSDQTDKAEDSDPYIGCAIKVYKKKKGDKIVDGDVLRLFQSYQINATQGDCYEGTDDEDGGIEFEYTRCWCSKNNCNTDLCEKCKKSTPPPIS